MGLSSAATLLRALQKFAPLTGDHAAASANTGNTNGTTSTGQHSVIPTIIGSPPVNEAHNESIVLPPASETRRLVDSYFHYFRTSTLPLPNSAR